MLRRPPTRMQCRAEAYAPGSIGNVGPGLDVLGLAVHGAGDRVIAVPAPGRDVTLIDPGHPALPSDPLRHASVLAARALLARLPARRRPGLQLTVVKGLPLSGGQGGSAASAVAGAGAVNALLGSPFGLIEVAAAALEAETAVAGRHADNVAPSTFGGLVLVRNLDPLDLLPLPVPRALHVVLAMPRMSLRTAEGRAALPAQVAREVVVHQTARVAAIVAAACQGDARALGLAIDDLLAEPARAPLLPGFLEAKRAALSAGALGCSISGSGPTAFALLDSPRHGPRVARAMEGAYRNAGLACETRLARPDRRGLRIHTE